MVEASSLLVDSDLSQFGPQAPLLALHSMRLPDPRFVLSPASSGKETFSLCTGTSKPAHACSKSQEELDPAFLFNHLPRSRCRSAKERNNCEPNSEVQLLRKLVNSQLLTIIMVIWCYLIFS